MELNGRLFLQVANFLRVLMFIFLSLYVLNAVGNLEAVQHWVGGRRYLNVLWIVMALYLLVSRFDMDRAFFVRQFRLLAPIGAVCVFLYFYHDRSFDLGFLKYAVLLVIAASVVRRLGWLDRNVFFRVNSVACLAIFAVALYQIIGLHRLVPDGDVNQNIFAPQAMIIGGISVFAWLYDEVDKKERLLHIVCGVLALWVALRTSCRTAYVSEMVLAVLFCGLAYRKYRWPLPWLLLGLAAVAAVMVAVVFCSPGVTESKFGRITAEIADFIDLKSGKTTESSIGLRLAMWQAALTEIIPQHFWLGVGEVSNVDFVSLFPHTKIDKNFLPTLQHFHNDGINIFVTGGLLLFVSANGLLCRLFQRAWSEPAMLCLLVGTVAFGMTEVTWLHKSCFLMLTSIWLLYECASSKSSSPEGVMYAVSTQKLRRSS